MDFLKKIQGYLVGASETVEEANNHIETEKAKYNTSTTKKVAIVTASVIFIVVGVVYFLF